VDAWRAYTPPSLPSWVTDDTQQWHPSIKKDNTLEFKINTLRGANDSAEWYWEAANVTLHHGDTIKITWTSNPDTENVLTTGDGLVPFLFQDPINYSISVSIGGTLLDSTHSRQFGWFMLPLITTNGIDEFEPGILAAERFFSASFKFTDELRYPSAYWMNHYFRFDVEGLPSIHDIGGSAGIDDEINAYISSTNEITWLDTDRLFNLTYDAKSGVLKKLIFTNTEGGDPSTGIISTPVIKGLKELIITGPDLGPVETTTKLETTTKTESKSQDSTPTSQSIGDSFGWPIVLVIFTFSLMVKFRKKTSKKLSSYQNK